MNGPFAELNSLIESAQPAVLLDLIGKLAAMQAQAQLRLMSGSRPEVEAGLLTIPQVAVQLKVSTYRAYELARQGELKAIRLGKSVRVKPGAVAEYLARQGA